MNGRIETKVYGALVGTALGGALAAFLIWLLGVVVWHGGLASSSAGDAVPTPVSGLILAALGLAGTAIGGYSAPRTSDAERGIAPTPVLPGDALLTGGDAIDGDALLADPTL